MIFKPEHIHVTLFYGNRPHKVDTESLPYFELDSELSDDIVAFRAMNACMDATNCRWGSMADRVAVGRFPSGVIYAGGNGWVVNCSTPQMDSDHKARMKECIDQYRRTGDLGMREHGLLPNEVGIPSYWLMAMLQYGEEHAAEGLRREKALGMRTIRRRRI